MKHLNLELEKLEQRIAPGGVTPPAGETGGSKSSGGSSSGSSKSSKRQKLEAQPPQLEAPQWWQ